jgi:nicotinate-nucleotide adenylyltransferase
VLFVPAANPPHKLEARITPAEHRVAMLEAAIEDNPRFGLYLEELKRPGRSYTIDTLREYHRQRMAAGDELFFILGADNLAEFNTWKDWQEITRLAGIAVLARVGSDPKLGFAPKELGSAEIVRLEMPLIGISATRVRKACADGHSIRYLVPQPVAEYIKGHGLYCSAGG